MPGDPNGAFYAGGRYHLMYLYNRKGSGFCWVTFPATISCIGDIIPTPLGQATATTDASVAAVSSDDGTAYLSYWMLGGPRGIGLAKSCDRNFDHWTKFPSNPVIRSTEWGVTEVKGPDGKTFCYGTADPSNIWKKNGATTCSPAICWCSTNSAASRTRPSRNRATGSTCSFPTTEGRDTSTSSTIAIPSGPTRARKDNMCPSFLPTAFSAPTAERFSGKHLLLFIAHNRGCQYYVGDYRNDKFYPNNHGHDLGRQHLFRPQSADR